jgi:cobalt-zinc-cadmium efflux system outer membrane protein
MRSALPWFIAGTAFALLGLASDARGVTGAQESDLAGAPITLAQSRELALQHNPLLAASICEIDAAAGAARQARAWPNPEIAVEVEDIGGDLPHWSESQTTYTISQRLELFGTRGARSDAGRFGLFAAQAQYECTRRDLLSETDRRFAELLAAQARRRLLQENARTADTLLAVVSALADAGETSPIDRERARTDQNLARIDLGAAELALTQARLALAALFGQRQPQFGEAIGGLEIDLALPAWGVLQEELRTAPELAWWEAEVSRRAALLTSERRSRLPALVLDGGYRQLAATREATYLASLALELPLFDRRSGAIEEAAAMLAQGETGRQAEAVQLATAGALAYEALRSALVQARTMRDSVAPGAREVYRALHEGYQRGKFSLLDALDARRQLAAAQLRAVDAWAAVFSARAELERAIGRSLEERKGSMQ